MNDKDTPHSGSRWEPAPVPPTTASDSSTQSASSTGTTAERPARLEAAGPGRRVRPFGQRGRGALAGATVAVVALGGLGGFALGYASAGDETDRVGLVEDLVRPGDDDAGQLPGRLPAPPPALDDDGDDGSGAQPRFGDGEGTSPDGSSDSDGSSDLDDVELDEDEPGASSS